MQHASTIKYFIHDRNPIYKQNVSVETNHVSMLEVAEYSRNYYHHQFGQVLAEEGKNRLICLVLCHHRREGPCQCCIEMQFCQDEWILRSCCDCIERC